MTDQTLLIKVRADSDKAIKQIKSLTKEVNSLSKGVKGTNKTLATQTKHFDGVTKATAGLNKQLVGLAATYLSFQGAKQLITTTADVEKGFIGVAKTTGLTGKAFAELEEEILSLSTEMAGIKIEGLQSIAETAGQLGISGKENILEFTRVVAMMGAATDLTAEEAATSMAKLGNSMKIPVEEFEKLGSVINELSNTTTATASNLVNMGQRIAGVGSTFGLTGDEVLGFAATLTDVGMSAELGGTAISKVMVQMLKDVEGFAKASGVSFEEFQKLIENKPVKALELFIASIGKLDKVGQIKALDDLKLKTSGVTQTMLKLSSSTELLSKNLKIAGDEWERNTSLQLEYETAAGGLEAQWTRVSNAFTVLAYKIGKELLPMMKDLINDTVLWLDTLDPNAIESFGQGVGKLFEGIIGIGKTFVWLNDMLMPDILGGKDGGVLDTAIAGWTRLGALITNAGNALQAIEDASALAMDVNEIDNAVASFNGLDSTYKALSTSLQSLLAENLRLQEVFRNNGSAEAKAQLASLREEQERIMDISMRLAEQKPLDDIVSDQVVNDVKNVGKEVEKVKQDIESDPATVKIETDADQWVKEYNASLAKLQDTPIKVDADTTQADAKITETQTKAKTPTIAPHTVKPDVSAVMAAIATLKKPTSSIHTIYVREVHTRANGGLIPQKLAVGGTFTGAGKVPGYDSTDSDKVNAKLTGGEFVVKRSAVDAYGTSLLHSINNMSLPKFANGGEVGGASSSGELQPINLNIGGESFKMMTDRDVAESLQRFIDSEGGL